MQEDSPGMSPDTLGTGVHKPTAFRSFSAERAKVVRMYADQDLSLVVWNLEPGQENDLHQHAENAHSLIVLEGQGHYIREDGSLVPIETGDCIIVPRGRAHGIRNTGNFRLSYFAVTSQGPSGYVRNVVAGEGH